MNMNSSLREVKGIGEKTEKLFQKMGVYTVGDILFHFPRTYQEYPQITSIEECKENELAAVYGTLRTPGINKNAGRMTITLATAFSEMGSVLELVWFRTPYVRSQLETKTPLIFYGKVSMEHGKKKMDQATIYTPEQYEKIRMNLQPIYPLTAGLGNQTIKKTVQTALEQISLAEEDIPEKFLQRHQLHPFAKAMQEVHMPFDFNCLLEGRRRLVYDEFFYFFLQMQFQKEKVVLEENPWTLMKESEVNEVIDQLPYELTQGQQNTIEEIRKDLHGDYVSQRLIQGDVGSGKTIVAMLAMLEIVSNGYQAAIMAPTEVLAMQHYDTFCEMMETYHLPYQVVYLTGSMTAKEKRETYKRIEEEDQLFIIGTHALIQEKVVYRNLALVITDEQHRFGVKQRDTFLQKGGSPHVLVMSATPIPRTLALILYGDMNISVISDMPARRLPIKNCVVGENYRKTAYDFIEQEVKQGHQAYIICPLVEASEKTEAENVTEYVQKLEAYYNGRVRVGLMHGKLKANEKNQVMNDYASHKIDVLVSTTVVEVGVNVPNATVMVIENANRFGLAQLHQLRGRVGRGDQQSYCVMFNTSKTKEAKKRLEILNESNDGFYIASEDLKMRGPGDFYGIRQSGEFNFKLGDVFQDADLLKSATEDVKELLEVDPELDKQEHTGLKQSLQYHIQKSYDCL